MKLTEQLRAGCVTTQRHFADEAKTNDLMRQAAEEIDRLTPTWRPIETAPRDTKVFFWLVPKVIGDEGVFVDSSGNPILAKSEGYRKEGEWGQWGCLMKATHWMPLPESPAISPCQNGRDG